MTTTNAGRSSHDDDQRAYEALAAQTRRALHRLTEAGGDTLVRAINEAKQQTATAGDFTLDQLERANDSLRRDLLALKQDSARATEFVQRLLDPSRIRSAFLGLAADVLTLSGDVIRSYGESLEEPIKYSTGEVTGPGTLTCLNCDTQLHFTESGRVPPCGNCHRTEFRKSY